jgi:endonuclease/exonuclease/phosphatase family metal-dependent hydrolase
MKVAIIFSLMFLFLSPSFGQDITDDQYLKVMSFNIRCASCEDSSDINHWSKRKRLVFQLFKKYKPDIIGLQEAEIQQIRDIENEFEDYEWIGKGRDDGKEKGEFTAVFYKRKRFDPWEYNTEWLSETPRVPSKGWDAALNRTVTDILFNDRKSEQIFCFFNTHFDHVGETARVESAKFLRKKASEYSGGYAPVIITGDFNFTENSEGYKVLTSSSLELDNLNPAIEYKSLLNSEYISEQPHSGGKISFNAFGRATDIISAIDFIFVNEEVKVMSHRTITDTLEGLFPSDHYPILVEIVFKDIIK